MAHGVIKLKYISLISVGLPHVSPRKFPCTRKSAPEVSQGGATDALSNTLTCLQYWTLSIIYISSPEIEVIYYCSSHQRATLLTKTSPVAGDPTWGLRRRLLLDEERLQVGISVVLAQVQKLAIVIRVSRMRGEAPTLHRIRLRERRGRPLWWRRGGMWDKIWGLGSLDGSNRPWDLSLRFIFCWWSCSSSILSSCRWMRAQGRRTRKKTSFDFWTMCKMLIIILKWCPLRKKYFPRKLYCCLGYFDIALSWTTAQICVFLWRRCQIFVLKYNNGKLKKFLSYFTQAGHCYIGFSFSTWVGYLEGKKYDWRPPEGRFVNKCPKSTALDGYFYGPFPFYDYTTITTVPGTNS